MQALVTGAAGGLGLAVARALAARGARVLIVDRDAVRGEQAVRQIRDAHPAAPASFERLDLGDLAEIRAFAARHDAARLDVLVNNAGILPSLARQTTADGFEACFGIGHLGHFALTGLLLPALLRAPRPRVVSVSSLVQAHGRIDFDDPQALRTYEPQRAYNQTKLAVLMFALELHARATRAGANLASLAAHPGVARTALGDARMREPPRRLRDRLERWAYLAVMRAFGQPPERSADAIVHAATSGDAHGGDFWAPGGVGQFTGRPARVAPSRLGQDPALRARLWDLSEQLTGVKYTL